MTAITKKNNDVTFDDSEPINLAFREIFPKLVDFAEKMVIEVSGIDWDLQESNHGYLLINQEGVLVGAQFRCVENLVFYRADKYTKHSKYEKYGISQVFSFTLSMVIDSKKPAVNCTLEFVRVNEIHYRKISIGKRHSYAKGIRQLCADVKEFFNGSDFNFDFGPRDDFCDLGEMRRLALADRPKKIVKFPNLPEMNRGEMFGGLNPFSDENLTAKVSKIFESMVSDGDLKEVVMESLEDITNPIREKFGRAVSNTSEQVSKFSRHGGTIVLVGLGCFGLAEVIVGYMYEEPETKTHGMKILCGVGLFSVTLFAMNKYQSGEKWSSLLEDYIFPTFTKMHSTLEGISFKEFKNWAQGIITLEKLTKAVPELFLTILSWLDDFINWVCKKRPFQSMFPNWIGMGEKFNTLVEDIREFVSNVRSGKIVTTVDTYDEVCELITRVEGFIVKGDKNHPKYSLLLTFRKDLEDCRKNVLSCLPSLESLRQEPATVLFVGDPGSYKTTIMNRLSDKLATFIQHDLSLENTPARFQMNASAKHMDGYSTGTSIITWDEFGQLRDQAGSVDSEYFLFVRMVNTNPCPLTMAAIESKGTTFCKAHFILGTSNCKKWNIESLVDSGAVNRRWQRQYVVCPKAQFAKTNGGVIPPPQDRSVDWEKVAVAQGKEPGMECNPLVDEIEYHEWITTPNGGRELGKMVTFDEIYEDITKRYERHKRIHRANVMLARENDLQVQPLDSVSVPPLDDDEASERFLDEEDRFNFVYSYCQKYMPVRDDFAIVAICKNLDAYCGEDGWKVSYVNAYCKQAVGLHVGLSFLSGSTPNLENLDDAIKEAMEFQEKFDKIYEGTVFALKVLTVLGGLYLGYKAIKGFMYPAVDQHPQSLVIKGRPKQESLRDLLGKSNLHGTSLTPDQPQMGHIGDPNGFDMAKSMLKRNQYTMYQSTKEGWRKCGYLLGLRGNLALIPLHFISAWRADFEEDKDTEIMFVRRNALIDHIHRVKLSDIFPMVILKREPSKFVRDFCFLRVPNSWGHFVDITHRFKSKSFYDNKVNFNHVALMVLDTGVAFKDGKTFLDSCMWQATGQSSFVASIPVMYSGLVDDIGPAYHYNLQTSPGCCGAVLLEMNPRVAQEKIIGIHISGNEGGYGHAIVIFKEDIELVLNQYDIFDCSNQDVPDTPQIGDALLETVFDPIKKVVPAMSNPRSSIKKSPAPFFGCLQEPMLQPSDVRDTNVLTSLAKHNIRDLPAINLAEVKKCVDAYSDWLFSVSRKDVIERIWTPEECVYGFEDYNSPTLTRSTSPGYPYVLQRKKKGKYDWLGDGVVADLDNDNWRSVLQDVEDIKRDILLGKRPMFASMINQKDELRKPGKAPRIFGAVSLPILLLTSMYNGSFVVWYQENRITNGSTLGINVYSTEWDQLASHIRSDYILSGDFSNFDQQRHPDLVWQCLDVIERFYSHSTHEDRVIRRALFLDCICPYYVYKEYMYESDNGLPSGQFLTATLNTVMHGVLTVCCVYDIFQKKIPPIVCMSYYKFADNGDDGLIGVSEEVSKYLNEESMSVACSKFGFIYTSDLKDGNFYLRKLEEISFLKREFRYEPVLGRYVAPLVLKRLKEFPNWTRKIDGDAILRNNMEKFLIELSAHGKEVFDKYSKIIVDNYKILWNVEPLYRTWKTCLDRFGSSETLPYGFQKSITNMNINKPEEFKRQAALGSAFMYIPNSYDIEGLYEDNEVTFDIPQMNSNMPSEDRETDLVFANDAIVVKHIAPFKNDSTFIEDARAGVELAQLTRWITKPVVVSSGNFQSTDGATSYGLFKWHEPLNQTILKNKMLGNYSIQADLVLTLTANPNNMQQGLYCLAYITTGGCAPSDGYDDNWLHMHRHNKTQITQLPHVKFDLNCDTEVKLTIPWSSGLNSFPFSGTATDWGCVGYFFIYPLYAIDSSSGSTTCAYTLFANYENVKLTTVGYPQMGKRNKPKKLDLQTEESEKDPRFVSRTLALGGEISDALAKVPLLNSVCGPLSWLLNAGADAAKAWGFSTPMLTDPPHRIARVNYIGMATTDGVDPVESLALTTGNHVQIEQGMCGNLDELAISGFVQRYAWIGTYNWSTSAAKDTLITNFDINPGYYTTTTDSTATLRNYTPMGWCREFFGHWRGSIVFRFHIIKTLYHSGRLLFYFEPYLDGVWTPGTANISNSAYCLRTILDIREHAVAEVRVPYVSIKPWQTPSKVTGKLRMIVLDPLVAPATVPNNVNIFVEVKGGPDFEFNAPVSADAFVPFVPNTYQMGDAVIESTENKVSEDMGQMHCKLDDIDLGPDKPIEVDSITHGQRILSLRQLVKRAWPVISNTTSTLTTSTYMFPPFASQVYKGTGAGISGSNTLVTRDLYTHLSCIFAYSRGGVRIRLVPTSCNTTQVYNIALDQVDNNATAVTSYFTATAKTLNGWLWKSGGLGLGWFHNITPSPGYFVPQHTNLLSRISANNIFNNTDSLTYVQNLTDGAQIFLYQQGSSAIPVFVYREGADDCNFGCFVSIPPVYTDTSP